MSAPRLAVLGFGEAGSSLARGLAGAGLAGIVAHDHATDEARRRRKAERATAAGATLLAGAEGLRAADSLFVCVQPAKAADAAAGVVEQLAPGTLYVDFSSLDPPRKAAVAARVDGAGHRYVDAVILGAPAQSLHRVPVLASGPAAADFAGRFAPYGMAIRIVGERAGDAAAIKIVRSIVVKGLEALYVEGLLVARRYGVADTVLDSVCAWLDGSPARTTAEQLLRSHVVHAARRADEAAMAAEAAEAVGIAPIVTRAVAGGLARTALAGLPERFAGQPPATLDEALTALDDALRASRPAP